MIKSLKSAVSLDDDLMHSYIVVYSLFDLDIYNVSTIGCMIFEWLFHH